MSNWTSIDLCSCDYWLNYDLAVWAARWRESDRRRDAKIVCLVGYFWVIPCFLPSTLETAWMHYVDKSWPYTSDDRSDNEEIFEDCEAEVENG